MSPPSAGLMEVANGIREDFVARFPAEAVSVLERTDEVTLAREFSGLGVPGRLAVLDRLPPARAAGLFARIPIDQQATLLAVAPTHLALSLAPSLPAAKREALLKAVPKSLRGEIERLVDLPDGAAGRLIDRSACVLNRRMTVGEAIEKVRAAPVRGERTLYLVDRERRLDGRIEMQALVLADREDRIGSHAQPAVSVDLVAPREEVVDLLERHRADSLPVVDSDRRLLGVVRHDQLFETIGEEASADMQKMVGVSPDERAMSTPGFAVRRRLPWLQVNLLTAFLASAVVAMFEGLIAQFTALAVLLPVVAGQGGNAGAQALAVTVRGIALREVSARDMRRLVFKELVAGAANGLALALVCGAGVYLWSGSTGLAVVISCAMILSMPAAGVSGVVVPMLLAKLNQDPATASSIILTTVTDVTGFLSFLGIALALSSFI